MGNDPLVRGAEPALGRVLVVGVEHRVGIAVPVITTLPAGRWQQAFAFATVRVAAGDLPANVTGVGEQHVQGNGADFTAGIRGLFHTLRTGQVEERVQAPVILEFRHLQSHAQAIAQCAALGAVEQRAVTGFVHGFANRPLTFDEVGFIANHHRLPFACHFVDQASALALEFFQEQVLVVTHDRRHAPGHLAIEPGQDHRQTGNSDPGGLVLRRADLHRAPQRGHAWRELAVAGQQALAAAAALWGDGPVVRGGGAQWIQTGQLLTGFRQVGQARDRAIELHALKFVRFGLRQLLVRVGRRQPRQFVGRDVLCHDQCVYFLRQVGRLAEIEQAENQRRILGFPVFGLVARGRQVRWQFVAIPEQVGVDPACIDFKEAFEAWGGGFIEFVGVFLEIDRAHVAVRVQHLCPGHFRQAPLGQQTQGDHLVDAVTGVYVTEGEQRIVEGAALNQWHAHGITSYGDVLCQPLERLHAGGRWQRVLGVPGLAP
ncbi:hypothetical protein D3C78_639720 [compost metagenome]